jgi:hypothetical protein
MSNDMSFDHNEAYMSTDSNKTCWLFFGDVYFQQKKKRSFLSGRKDGQKDTRSTQNYSSEPHQNWCTCLKFEILFAYF